MKMSTQVRLRQVAALGAIGLISTFVTACVLTFMVSVLHTHNVVQGELPIPSAWGISVVAFVASITVKKLTDFITEVVL